MIPAHIIDKGTNQYTELLYIMRISSSYIYIYSPRIRRLDFAVLDRTASHAHHNSLGKK